MLTRQTISTATWIGTESAALQLRETPVGLIPATDTLVRCASLRSCHDYGLVLGGNGRHLGGLRHFLKVGACREFPLLGLAKGGYGAGQKRGCFMALAATNFQESEEIPELLVVGKHEGDRIFLNPRHAWFFQDAILTRLPDAVLTRGTDVHEMRNHLKRTQAELRIRDDAFMHRQFLLLGQSERERVVTYCVYGIPVEHPHSIAPVVSNYNQLTGITKKRKVHR